MKPVLVMLDLDKNMKIEANILDFAIGRVLLMKYKDEKWRPVTYISLSKAERNYEIYNKEMLAIIKCLEA